MFQILLHGHCPLTYFALHRVDGLAAPFAGMGRVHVLYLRGTTVLARLGARALHTPDTFKPGHRWYGFDV